MDEHTSGEIKGAELMIVIPEINAIYIRTPATEDGKFTSAIMRKYPLARPLYDHMETDGIPVEYKHYEKIGIVRDPISRLWDFYCSHRNDDASTFSLEIYGEGAKRYDFEDWLVLNNACVHGHANPVMSRENGKLYGFNEIIHQIPENKKSQYFYLMPTHGHPNMRMFSQEKHSNEIMIFPYTLLNNVAESLGITEDVTPEDLYGPSPEIESALVKGTVFPLFTWDFQMCKNMRTALTMTNLSKTA